MINDKSFTNIYSGVDFVDKKIMLRFNWILFDGTQYGSYYEQNAKLY